jgi:hypothetical protein
MTTPTRSMIAAIGLVTILAAPGTVAPTPVTAASSDLESVAPEILERVEQIRGLQALTEVPVRAVDPEVAVLEAIEALEDEDIEELLADEAMLKRLGLLPDEMDLLSTLESFIGTDVAGYYRPDQADIAIVDSGDLGGGIGQWILAHEYVHALQDQHFDLEATRDAYPLGDAQTAVSALTEGDATFLMTAMATGDALSGDVSAADLAGVGEDDTQLDGLPLLLSRELLFSYLDGMAFVQRMWGRGGWSNVDEVWRDPPRSTEQIMHPEHYPDEQPVAVELPDVAALLGDGWEPGYETSMGELRLSILVSGQDDYEIPEVPLWGITLDNAEAAAGWGGDTILNLDGPDGTWAAVWQTTWDAPADAAEFAPAADAALADLVEFYRVAAGTDISGSAPDDQGVLLLVADGAETLAALEDKLGSD